MGRRIIGSIALLLISALPAGAATITIGGLVVNDQGQFSNVAGATTVDFNALATVYWARSPSISRRRFHISVSTGAAPMRTMW